MNIKELAEQAGLMKILNEHASEYGNGYYIAEDYPELENFAALIRQDEAQACAKHYLGIMRDAVEQAVLRERESCAKLCEDLTWNASQFDCAEAIRAKGDKHD